MRESRAKPSSGLRVVAGVGSDDVPDDEVPGLDRAPAAAAKPATKGPYDKEVCPPGWDEDIWSLTKLFQQRAWAARIELRAGPHLIYAELADLIKRHGLMERSFRHEVAGCRRRALPRTMADYCWYHYPPANAAIQQPGTITWDNLVVIIIYEFWSHIWDEYALDNFRQHFAEYGQAALDHWHRLSIGNAVRPGPARRMQPPARRGTMTDASKEG